MQGIVGSRSFEILLGRRSMISSTSALYRHTAHGHGHGHGYGYGARVGRPRDKSDYPGSSLGSSSSPSSALPPSLLGTNANATANANINMNPNATATATATATAIATANPNANAKPNANTQTSQSSSSSALPAETPIAPEAPVVSVPEPVPTPISAPISASTHASISTSPPPPAPSANVPPSRTLRQIIVAGPVGKLGRMYARGQDKRPYTTQVIAYIFVYLCGDLSAQLLFSSDTEDSAKKGTPEKEKDGNGLSTENKEGSVGGKYDPWRAFRHVIVGIGSSIPTYIWFMFLHNHFNFASKYLSLLTKVVVQQLVYTPIFNTYFFGAQSLLAGATLTETWERLKLAVPESIKNSVKLWPAVTAFSFMYITPEYRNVFSGLVAVGWQSYLSWLNQKAARKVEVAEREQLVRSSHGLAVGSRSDISSTVSGGVTLRT